MVDKEAITTYSALAIAIVVTILLVLAISLLIHRCMVSDVADACSMKDPCGCFPLAFRKKYCKCCVRNRGRVLSHDEPPPLPPV